MKASKHQALAGKDPVSNIVNNRLVTLAREVINKLSTTSSLDKDRVVNTQDGPGTKTVWREEDQSLIDHWYRYGLSGATARAAGFLDCYNHPGVGRLGQQCALALARGIVDHSTSVQSKPEQPARTTPKGSSTGSRVLNTTTIRGRRAISSSRKGDA